MFIDTLCRVSPSKERAAAPTGRRRCSTNCTAQHCLVCIASTGVDDKLYSDTVDLDHRQASPSIVDRRLLGICGVHNN